MRIFEVENAGCPSCAQKVRTALSRLGDVHDVVIDERADTATVYLAAPAEVEERDVERALGTAVTPAGHAYCVKPGSWRLEASA